MSAPVSRRARPAKAPLSREVIVRAGLAVLDHDGIDALTMRRVAQELDTGPASLYVYVAHRDDLLAAMLDAAMAEVARPPASGPWRDRLAGLLDAAVAELSRHEGLALVAFGAIPTGEHTLVVLDRMLALLLEGGVDEVTAAWAADLLWLVTVAEAADERAHADQGGTEEATVAAAAERFAALSPQRYPALVALRGVLLAGGGDHQRARWWRAALLNGILATPAAP